MTGFLADHVTPVDLLVILAFVPAAGFPIVYAFYPWWKTPVGRSTMGLAIVIAEVMGLAAWRAIFDVPAPEWVRAIAYTTILIALWSQFIVLLLAPRLNRRRKFRERLPIPPEVPHGT